MSFYAGIWLALAMSVTNISCQQSQVNSAANILHNSYQQKCDCTTDCSRCKIPTSQKEEDCSDFCITALSPGSDLPKKLEDKVDARCRHKIEHALQTECAKTIHCSRESDASAGS